MVTMWSSPAAPSTARLATPTPSRWSRSKSIIQKRQVRQAPAVFFLGLSVPCFIKKRVKREIIVTNEQKTFIKETQKKIQEDGLFDKEEISKTTPEKSLLFSFEDVLQPEEKSVKKVKVEQTKKVEKERGFDYSNVKTAIEKTLKKDLLPEEKRKIVGLEIAILQSERGEDNMAIKEEVNEGLSSLLKIMSRYSV